MTPRNDNLDLSRSNPESRHKALSSDLGAQKVLSYDSRASSKGSARRIYQNYYHHYRLHGDEPLRPRTRIARQMRDCAKRSWLDRDSELTGWINQERLLKFAAGNADNYHSVWGIPF